MTIKEQKLKLWMTYNIDNIKEIIMCYVDSSFQKWIEEKYPNDTTNSKFLNMNFDKVCKGYLTYAGKYVESMEFIFPLDKDFQETIVATITQNMFRISMLLENEHCVKQEIDPWFLFKFNRTMDKVPNDYYDNVELGKFKDFAEIKDEK